MSLPRERLTGLLNESALTSVELVIAPPGYGKSTVLREYAAGDPEAVYIPLPEPTDLEAFVRAVITAAVPSAVRSVGAVFENVGEENLEERAADWLTSRLRALNGPLIIDDFHRTGSDSRVVRVLISVINQTRGRMKWIVASRQAPAFPMGTWIARGWTGLPITSDDLAFTVTEGAALAESLGIEASEDEISGVIRDTLGWPLGVRLALSLVSRKRGQSKTRIQTREALFSLIEDEIWKPLSDDLRRLASAAALMPTPTIATLTASGFENARAGMSELAALVPFITTVDEDAFTIHDLFREFVATSVAPEASYSDTAQRLGTALVDSGKTADGLRLLISAGRVADVERSLTQHAFDLLETGQRGIVNSCLAFLSEHNIDDTGLTLAVRGALAFADGSATNSTNLYIRALERELAPTLRGEVSRRLALGYGNRGNFADAIAVVEPLENDTSLSFDDQLDAQAMATMFRANGTDDRAGISARISALESQIPNVRPAMQSRILQRLGVAAFYIGDEEAAERLSSDAVLLATELGLDTIAALGYGTLHALSFLADPDIGRARLFSRSQAAAAERAANSALRVYALRHQYIMAAYDLEIDEAERIEAHLATLIDARSYVDSFIYRYARALVYVAKGELGKAEAALRSTPATSMTHAQRVSRDAFLIVISLLKGKRSAALAELGRPLVFEAPGDIPNKNQLANAYAFRGLAYWALDRPAQARRSFEIDLGGLYPRSRLLVDTLKAFCTLPHPVPNRSVADPMVKTLEAASFRVYSELLKRLVEVDANDVELSAAELETLREFDRYGGRAVDVAKALGKSRFTVQNQIQSAIKKLGCSGRAEALAYARQRGWLDPHP